MQRITIVVAAVLISANMFAQPSNDNCGGAVLLTPNIVCAPTTGTDNGATSSGIAASSGCPVGNPDDDVWYYFNATDSIHIITVYASFSFMPCFEVFDGGNGTIPVCPAAVNSITCNAIGGNPGDTIFSVVSTTIGEWYYVRVYDYGVGQPPTTTFNICVTVPPINDECAGATALAPSTTCIPTSGTVAGATASYPATCGGTVSGDVWYSFTATTSSQIITVVGSAPMNAVYELFSSNPCGGTGTSLGCVIAGSSGGTATQTFTGLISGITYWVRVYDFAGSSSASTFTICVVTPVNNICANAITVVCGGNYTGNTNIGIANAPASCTSNLTITPGLWYVYPGTGNNVTASLCGGTFFDSQIFVYSSTGSCTGLSCVGGNDDLNALCPSNGLASASTFGTVIGTNYYIYVCGYAGSGSFTLHISCTSNSFNCNAIQINNACSISAYAQCSGGIPPYTYVWSNGQLNDTVTNLTVNGSGPYYHVTATDSVGNTAMGFVTVTPSTTPPITLNASATNVNCINNNSGSIIVSASGGVGTLQYSDNGGSTYQLSNLFNGLGVGIYPIIVKDSNNCTSVTQQITITQASAPTFTDSTTNVACFGNNGSIGISASGGVAPILYSIDSGATYHTSSIFTGLAVGTYPVLVQDANGCTAAVQHVTVTQAVAPTFTHTSANVTCFGGSNGTITINASGGTGTYQYSKNNGSTYQASNTFTGLIAGTYHLVVMDANSCVRTDSVIITQPSAVVSATASHTNVSCHNGNNGTAIVTATGGTPPYHYSWTPFVGTSAAINHLTAGTYTIVVTDTNNCSTFTTATLTQPTTSVSVATSVVNTPCGTSTGQITATPTGGNTPYHYLWSNGDTLNITSNLSSGSYSVIVTDNHGCTVFSPLLPVITTHATFAVDFLAATTLGAAPFTVSFTNTTPSMSNYNFTWYWGDATSTASNNATMSHTYTNGGYYDVSLIAVDITTGCADTLLKPQYIFATGAPCTQTVTVSPASAFSGCIGDTLTLTANTNASAGYTIQWNRNSIPVSGANNATYIVTQGGNYSVTIISGSCPVTSSNVSATFNNPPATPVITATGTIAPCTSSNVTLTASALAGGTYLWSTAQTTQTITVNTPGTYSVTETSGTTGCSATSLPFSLTTSLPVTQLCMVTADSLSTHNIVIWEKTNVTAAIDSFRIYREVSPNIYTNIASVSNDSLSEYIDYSANPNTSSYRYKLQALDTCGSLSALSNFHQTIYLQCNGNGAFQWTLYYIQNGTNPVSHYTMQRDSMSTGNFVDISGAIPASNTTYTDTSFANYPLASYRLAVTWLYGCTPTRSVNTSYSNISHEVPLGIAHLSATNTITIYPNPFTASTTISFSEIQKHATLKITDIVGKTISDLVVSGSKSITIEKGTMNSGIYFISIIDDNKNMINRKIVVQ